jgi:hypothetical protein
MKTERTEVLFLGAEKEDELNHSKIHGPESFDSCSSNTAVKYKPVTTS